MDVRMPDGTLVTDVPDGITQTELLARYQKRGRSQPTEMDEYLDNPWVRAARTAKSGLDAAAQGLARIAEKVPMSAIPFAPPSPRGQTVMDAANRLSAPFQGTILERYMADPSVKGVDKDIRDAQSEYEQSRKAFGKSNEFDWPGFAGHLVDPTNVIPAKVVSKFGGAALTVPELAKAGALGGFVSSFFEPVSKSEDQESFLQSKAKQASVSTAGGAVLGPIIGKVVGYAAARRKGPSAPSGSEIDDAIDVVFKNEGLDPRAVSQSIRDSIRADANAALKANPGLDPKAAIRLKDFESLGMDPMLGQIMRDPIQYAKERNLRGAPGGERLMLRLTQQNQQLHEIMDRYSGVAKQSDVAGREISGALKGVDEAARQQASALYRSARTAAQNADEIPMQGLAQDAADIFHRYDEAGLSGIKRMMTDYGLIGDGMRKTKVFSYDEAENLLKQINKLPYEQASAASELRQAVKRSILESGSEGPYAAARAAARGRFNMQDAVPALKAAADGTVDPADFVRRFIVNGKPGDVQGMAKVLKEASPSAYEEARSQLGTYLRTQAFGQDLAQDAAFSPSRFAKALKEMNDSKLSAFFTKDEISALHTVARVGSYIHQVPNASTVNFSNNSAWALDILGRIPGLGPVGNAIVSLVKGGARTIGQDRVIRNALEAKPALQPPTLSPEQERELFEVLSKGAFVPGGLLSPLVAP